MTLIVTKFINTRILNGVDRWCVFTLGRPLEANERAVAVHAPRISEPVERLERIALPAETMRTACRVSCGS